MRVLVIDIGGTNVKILATGQETARKFPSGRKLTPKAMVSGVKALAGDWQYDAVSIGYPGVVHDGRITVEPPNLGHGWVGFNFESAFGHPVRIINDAAMQAVGSYKRGLLLFLGFGTGIGATLVVDDVVIPMELGHLSFKNATLQAYVGIRALRRLGRKRWQKHVEFVIARMIQAVIPDDVVIGGGHAKKLRTLPKGCRLGGNAYAFVGGFRMWDDAPGGRAPVRKRSRAV